MAIRMTRVGGVLLNICKDPCRVCQLPVPWEIWKKIKRPARRGLAVDDELAKLVARAVMITGRPVRMQV